MRTPRWTRGAVTALLGCALVAGAFVAGRQSLDEIGRAAEAAPPPPPSALWEVKQEQVGRSLRLSGSLARGARPAPAVAAQGVVTSVDVDPSAPLAAGSTLFTVNLRPVVAGQGAIPAFRDLGRGAQGADVLQLRQFLCGLGRLAACTSTSFDAGLEAAVATWNAGRGLGDQRTVAMADILWFPTLPQTLVADDKFTVGSRVEPGQQVFTAVDGAVSLSVDLTREQAALVPVGAAVHLDQVEGVVAAIEPGAAEGRMSLRITAPDGTRPICEAESRCVELLGATRTRPVEVTVDVVPRAEGLAVPVRALRTDARGAVHVVDAAGNRHPVTVGAEAGGMVICDGLTAGLQVVLDDAAG